MVVTVREGQQRVCDLDADTRVDGTTVVLDVLGFGDHRWSRRGEEHVERLELRAVEDPRPFGDAFDLVDEAVTFESVARVLQRVLGEHDHEARRDAAALSAQDAAHALDHLPSGPTRTHHDAEVRVRHVDALVEHAGRGDGIERPDPEIAEDLAPLPPRVEPVISSTATSGSSRLIA